MTRDLSDLIVSLFRCPTDDAVSAEACSRREEIVAHLKRPEALELLDRLPDERSREQLSLVFTLFADLSEQTMANNSALMQERDSVEAMLCDAFDGVLLHNLPAELRDLGRRLEQAGARKLDQADLEYLLEEPVLTKALSKAPLWRGWEEWGVTPLSLHSAMQGISVLARKRSQGFGNVRLLPRSEASGERDARPEQAAIRGGEAANAVVRATGWSPEVATVAYDWMLQIAPYVPRLFEHFRIEEGGGAEIVLVPSTIVSRTDPNRFAKRWQPGKVEESESTFISAAHLERESFSASSRSQQQLRELNEDASTFRDDPREGADEHPSRYWLFIAAHRPILRNTAIACGMFVLLAALSGIFNFNVADTLLSMSLNIPAIVSEGFLTYLVRQ